MKRQTNEKTFAEVMSSFSHRLDLYTLFDDFLSVILYCISVYSENGASADEDIGQQMDNKYADILEEWDYAKLFTRLLSEVKLRGSSIEGNDILGEFYETHLREKRNGQLFIPYPLCLMMTRRMTPKEGDDSHKSILDPACGSGRLLIATARTMGCNNEFYGIDTDCVCVKITAINLFLNGILRSEAMCIDALNPEHFIISYKMSANPLGIERITGKESSELWLRRQASMHSEGASFISVQDFSWM